MSFPRYDSYKESGVDWLGGVPSHWCSLPFWALFRRKKRCGFPDEELLSVYRDFGVIRKSDRQDNFNNASDDLAAYQLVTPGDLVINKMKAWQGSLGVAPCRGIVSPAYFVFEALGAEEPRYLHYLLRSAPYAAGFMTISKGIRPNQWDLDPDHLAQVRVFIPSHTEQSEITAFLDRETAKIDALVEAQQRLIELLKEKRQAVISHAVTKGLDPSAPMKDSGVEWLGQVPAHWRSAQVGRFCSAIADGPHFSPRYVDDGVMFISARNIKVDRWSLDDVKYVSELDYEEFCRRIIPELDDVLYTKGGTTGIARVVDLAEKFQIWVHVAVLKVKKRKMLPAFLASSLNGAGCYEQSQLHTRGATNQDLGLTRMSQIWLCEPPMNEQVDIFKYLEGELPKIDKLSAEVDLAIRLLQERRSALISAAVTGKIDVRGLAAAPQEAQAA